MKTSRQIHKIFTFLFCRLMLFSKLIYPSDISSDFVCESSPVPPLSLQEPPGPRPPLLSMMEPYRMAWTWARWWWTRKRAQWFWSSPCASTSTAAARPAPWWWRAKTTASAGAPPETSQFSSESRTSLPGRASASRWENDTAWRCEKPRLSCCLVVKPDKIKAKWFRSRWFYCVISHWQVGHSHHILVVITGTNVRLKAEISVALK